MSPSVTQMFFSSDRSASPARAFARQMPLMPPAEVPAMMSTTNRVRTGPPASPVPSGSSRPSSR